jgi:hypothetical protein
MSSEGKERMNWLLGKEEATRIFKKAEMSRHTHYQIMREKLINPNLSAHQYDRSLKQDLIKYKSELDEQIKKAKTDHGETIQEYTFLNDIIKIVCPMIIE